MKNINLEQQLEKAYHFSPSSLRSSEVLNTLIFDCCLNALSSDQIGELSFSANAKYSTSSGSEEINFASSKNSLNSSVAKNFIFGESKTIKEKISLSFNPDFSTISALWSLNSFKINLGEINSSCLIKNRFSAAPFAIIAANNSFASTTITFITNLSFLAL